MKIDTPATKDLLDRLPFATRIADGIASTASKETECFIIGLTGKWGSGKSTLMTYVRQELETKCKEEQLPTTFIDFNPWLFTEEEDIRKAFLKNFIATVSPSKKYKWLIQKPVDALLRGINILEWLGLSRSPSIWKDFKNVALKYVKDDSSVLIKSKLDKMLLQSQRKHFVFIDDIDRLSPKQVFEVFQTIKLTAAFKNTFYVIAYDREVVELSIETQFKGYGKKYLDKIIQADFIIPQVAEEKIEEIFFIELENLFNSIDCTLEFSKLSTVWLHYGLKGYFTNLRDVYRFVNSLQFSAPNIFKNIDVIDFIVLEAIRLYDFEGYENIYDRYRVRSLYFDRTEKSLLSEVAKPFSTVYTERLYRFLFPENAAILEITESNTKRLHDPAIFNRYYTLQVSSKDVAEEEFSLIMSPKTNRHPLLMTILAFGRMKNLTIRLSDTKVLEKYNNWDYSLIIDLYRFFDDHYKQLEPFADNYCDAITNLLEVKKEEAAYYIRHFLSMLKENGSRFSYSKLYFLHYILLDKEKDIFSRNAPTFKQYYTSHYEELKSVYFDYLKQWNTIFINPPIPEPLSIFSDIFVFDYAKFCTDDYIKRLTALLSNEQSLLFFLRRVLAVDVNSEKAFRVFPEKIAVFFPEGNFQTFLKAIEAIDKSYLKGEQKQWREFLLDYGNETAKEN